MFKSTYNFKNKMLIRKMELIKHLYSESSQTYAFSTEIKHFKIV